MCATEAVQANACAGVALAVLSAANDFGKGAKIRLAARVRSFETGPSLALVAGELNQQRLSGRCETGLRQLVHSAAECPKDLAIACAAVKDRHLVVIELCVKPREGERD